eukprot:2339264-Amphidinium_carterae.1
MGVLVDANCTGVCVLKFEEDSTSRQDANQNSFNANLQFQCKSQYAFGVFGKEIVTLMISTHSRTSTAIQAFTKSKTDIIPYQYQKRRQ